MKIRQIISTLPLMVLLIFGASAFDPADAGPGRGHGARQQREHSGYENGRRHKHKQRHRYERPDRPRKWAGRHLGRRHGHEHRYERGHDRHYDRHYGHRDRVCRKHGHRHWRRHYHDGYGGIRFLFGFDLGNARIVIRH